MDENGKTEIGKLLQKLLEYAMAARKNGILSLSKMLEAEQNPVIRGGLEIVLNLGEEDELQYFFDKQPKDAEGDVRIEIRMILETCRGIRDGLHPDLIKDRLSAITG